MSGTTPIGCGWEWAIPVTRTTWTSSMLRPLSLLAMGLLRLFGTPLGYLVGNQKMWLHSSLSALRGKIGRYAKPYLRAHGLAKSKFRPPLLSNISVNLSIFGPCFGMFISRRIGWIPSHGSTQRMVNTPQPRHIGRNSWTLHAQKPFGRFGLHQKSSSLLG